MAKLIRKISIGKDYRGAKWTQIARLLSLNDPRIVKRRYQDALIELFYKQ